MRENKGSEKEKEREREKREKREIYIKKECARNWEKAEVRSAK